MTTLVWLRRDLRLADHPALRAYVGRVCSRPAFLKARQEQLDHFAAADAARAKG